MEDEEKKEKVTMRSVSGNEPGMAQVKELIISLMETLEVAKATTDQALSAMASCLSYILAQTDVPIVDLKKEIVNLNTLIIQGVEAMRKEHKDIKY